MKILVRVPVTLSNGYQATLMFEGNLWGLEENNLTRGESFDIQKFGEPEIEIDYQ